MNQTLQNLTNTTQEAAKCDQDCQYLYTTIVFWFSFGCTALTVLITLCHIIQHSKSSIDSSLKRRMISFLIYMPVMLTTYTLYLYLEEQDYSSSIARVLEVFRRVLQIYAFWSFWKMTEKYISEDRVKDSLQRKLYGYHFRPFRYCIKPFNFLTEEQYNKSMRKIRFNINQAIFFQILPILAYIFMEAHPRIVAQTKEFFVKMDHINKVVEVTLILETISLFIASYYILLYARILRQEYNTTNWVWKYTIYFILVFLSNMQWVILRSNQKSFLSQFFEETEAAENAELLVLTTNAILVAPETFLSAVVSLFAFNPSSIENDPRLNYLNKSEMSFTTARAYQKAYDGLDEELEMPDPSFN